MYEDVKPTDEGVRRYPETGGYYTANNVEDGDRGTPCTCKPSCPRDCKGECGCPACGEAYGDYLSMPQ
jgi:hypothetical protein